MHFAKIPDGTPHAGWVGITGVKLAAPLKVEEALAALALVSKQRSVALQIVEPKYLSGPLHVIHAANLAVRSHRQKRGRAKRIELEIMVYLSGKRQIAEAITALGARNGTLTVALIALGSSEQTTRSALLDALGSLDGREIDSIIELTKNKKAGIQKLYEISDKELKIVARDNDWKEGLLRCVMERVALLDAVK